MKLQWFNRPSVYFKSNPDLLRDRGAVSSFLSEMVDLQESILTSQYSKSYLVQAELDAEIKWLNENRQDGPTE